jgi:hypothetical protein
MLRLAGALRHINSTCPALGAQSNETAGIGGQHTGTARPFPLWRLRSSPYWLPIDPNSGVVLPPGPNSWRFNIRSAWSVPRTLRLPISIARQCDPFATYRRVSQSPTSMICRCIAKQAGEEPRTAAWTTMPSVRREELVAAIAADSRRQDATNRPVGVSKL